MKWYQLSWWGYGIVLYPAVLFLNDKLDFLPHENVVELAKNAFGQN